MWFRFLFISSLFLMAIRTPTFPNHSFYWWAYPRHDSPKSSSNSPITTLCFFTSQFCLVFLCWGGMFLLERPSGLVLCNVFPFCLLLPSCFSHNGVACYFSCSPPSISSSLSATPGSHGYLGGTDSCDTTNLFSVW